MSDRLPVNVDLLRWARERASLDLEDLVKAFPKYEEWERGELLPTFKQLERFAKKTYAPIGYFFLNKPPVESLPIPDFRRLSGVDMLPSPQLLDTIRIVQRRQSWMRDFLLEQGELPLGFVASKTIDDVPKEVADDIRIQLKLDYEWASRTKSWEEALRLLIQRIEAANILVMTNGVVDNNTTRVLDVDEFRGFVISDDIAPIIFINGADAKAAQMFTLVHELAHIWLGEAGVSNFKYMLPTDHAVEIFCNKVAAEFLVPEADFHKEWRAEAGLRAKRCKKLANRYKVSPLVVSRRAFDLGLVSKAQYLDFYNGYMDELDAVGRKSKSGGNFYATQGVRLGKRFSEAVYCAARGGALSYGEAYKLTGLSGKTYETFGERSGYRI